MSGICGILHLDGSPVLPEDLPRMASLLERRGPDGTALWQAGTCGLGHTRLDTTPETLLERLPLVDPASGCVITADVRLDNRGELLAALRLSHRAGEIGDAGIVLAAYLEWGEACIERFLGDFAFAIWNPREQALFCARDPFGMRPLYYHHTAHRLFAFASEPRAILVLPQVPCRIHEARIADFLVNQLEGIDKVSTFFEEVWRLPPAHALTVTRQGLRPRRYWTLEPGPELRLSSDEAYAEAFLEVFTEAVRCRLRSIGPVGSMLSGGMDSGSVVAVARQLLADTGRGPLLTFSAVAPDPTTCIETSTIQAAQSMEALAPCSIDRGRLEEFLPELEELTRSLDEPFDNHMTLPRVVYLAAHRHGLRALLDGVGGDVVLTDGSRLARLLRAGHPLAAYREIVGLKRFWGKDYPTWRELRRSARAAYVPDSLRRLRRRLLGARRVAEVIRKSMISPDFARRVALDERLRTLDEHRVNGLRVPCPMECARDIDHAYLTVGRERYDRAASAVAVEPRDPFLDRRVAAFCLALPAEQKLGGGWPKAVLRRAMAGRLPDAVRWRPGKEHLGWSFTKALMEKIKRRLQLDIEANWDIVGAYIDVGQVRRHCEAYFSDGCPADEDARAVYEVAHLGVWLRRNAERPCAAGRLTTANRGSES